MILSKWKLWMKKENLHCPTEANTTFNAKISYWTQIQDFNNKTSLACVLLNKHITFFLKEKNNYVIFFLLCVVASNKCDFIKNYYETLN